MNVKLDKKAGVGQLSCAVCGQQFQCGIHTLMEAIDVYSEWVDAAGTFEHFPISHLRGGGMYIADGQTDAVAKEAANDRATGSSTSHARPGARAPIANREIDDEEDDRRYEGEGIVADDDDY